MVADTKNGIKHTIDRAAEKAKGATDKASGAAGNTA